MRIGYYRDLLCPMEPAANAEARRKLFDQGMGSDKWAKRIREACKQDVLLFVNAFGWILEPRDTLHQPRRPFLTWNMQELALRTSCKHLGVSDIFWKKCRGAGATWLILYHFLQRFLFFDEQHFGLVSRTEEVVDNAQDPDALMQKLDFALKYLPPFLLPDTPFDRARKRLFNKETGSSFIGYATTGGMMAGGRKLAVMMDELGKFPFGEDYKALATTQHTTDSRYLVSALYQPSGAYYDIFTDPNNGMVTVELPWQGIPERARGRYCAIDGKLRILDDQYAFPSDYEFQLDGLERSPWIDREFKRAGAAKRDILQQIYMMPEATGSQFFEYRVLQHAATEQVKTAVRVGMLTYDPEECAGEFCPSDGGPMLIWCPLDHRDRPPEEHEYTVGADIASGADGAYSHASVAQVLDLLTGEQVAEYVTHTEDPTQFAKTCIAISKYFNRAFLNWEANGPVGVQFTKEVQRVGYGNIYYQDRPNRLNKVKTPTPGWHNNGTNLAALFGEMQRAIARDELVVRSQAVLTECRQYIWVMGKLTHAKQQGMGLMQAKNHGDRVVALGLAWMARQDRPPTKVHEEEKKPPPYACMARRLADWDEKEMASTESNW